MEDAQPGPTPEQLSAIEDLLGAPLPQSFRDFLQVANDGYLEYVIDVPMGQSDFEEMSFCKVFSCDEGEFGDETFVGEIRSCREYQKLPPGVPTVRVRWRRFDGVSGP